MTTSLSPFSVAKRSRRSDSISGVAYRWSKGTSKKPWICPACRSMEMTRGAAPALVDLDLDRTVGEARHPALAERRLEEARHRLGHARVRGAGEDLDALAMVIAHGLPPSARHSWSVSACFSSRRGPTTPPMRC